MITDGGLQVDPFFFFRSEALAATVQLGFRVRWGNWRSDLFWGSELTCLLATHNVHTHTYVALVHAVRIQYNAVRVAEQLSYGSARLSDLARTTARTFFFFFFFETRAGRFRSGQGQRVILGGQIRGDLVVRGTLLGAQLLHVSQL